MGLFGGSSTKVSSASANGSAASGIGDFKPVNDINFNAPFIDLTKPVNILVFSGLCYVGWLAWRKFKK